VLKPINKTRLSSQVLKNKYLKGARVYMIH